MRTQAIVIILLSLSLPAIGQQDPQFSQNMFTRLSYNPAYTGSHGKICATALHRQQWYGFGDGAPEISVFNFDAAISPFGINAGVGLSLIQDRVGFSNNLGANLSLAYRFEVWDGNLSFGANGGMINYSLTPQWVIPSGTSVHSSNDPAIPEEVKDAMALDLGFGIYYHTEEMYIGFSSTHLNEPTFNPAEGGATPKIGRNYYLISGYNLPIQETKFELNPSLLVQSDGTTSQISLNTHISYNKKFWGGVSIRTDKTLTGMIGARLFNWVKVGYSYDLSVSELSKYHQGSHEIMVGFCFDVRSDESPRKYKSIRFL
ncbi:MAG: type IX secretion system membrane protein PorP/SprF [Bacteroidales bacterium]|nr:type IX secretion system membrane protein PorP/SprF [Bacteroidales bacterium]